jgi:hypothetical protein
MLSTVWLFSIGSNHSAVSWYTRHLLCMAADVDVVLCSEQVEDGLTFVSRGLRDSAPAVQHTLLNGLADAMLGVLDTLPTKEASTPPTAAQVPVACMPPHCPLLCSLIMQACGRHWHAAA